MQVFTVFVKDSDIESSDSKLSLLLLYNPEIKEFPFFSVPFKIILKKDLV